MSQQWGAPQPQPQYQGQPGYGYQPPPPRRNTGAVALIASLAVLAVLVIAIVVVLAVRRDNHEPSVTQPQHQSAGPVDTCLIGNWKQTQFKAGFDLSDVNDAAGKALGTVQATGGGRLWRITADGTATEDFASTRYSGRTSDGRQVDLTFTGKNDWTLKTANHQLLFVSTGSNVEMSVTVNGKPALHDTVNPHNNPQPYTCATNSWSTTSLTDATASATYERV